jgi:hypothetical protein
MYYISQYSHGQQTDCYVVDTEDTNSETSDLVLHLLTAFNATVFIGMLNRIHLYKTDTPSSWKLDIFKYMSMYYPSLKKFYRGLGIFFKDKEVNPNPFCLH